MSSIWKCGSREFNLNSPVLMGILNCTPDSFSDGGDHCDFGGAIAHARELLEAGADIIDVGGESTRPGAEELHPGIELSRVLPVVRALAEQDIAVSIDTRHAMVAEACVAAGACVINDVSGFRDRAMREVAAGCDAGLVVMHMQGSPQNMQDAPTYIDVVDEVARDLQRFAQRLQMEGIDPGRICIDPGIGFGKNIAHNQALVQATSMFAALGYPLMAAVSRKSFMGFLAGIEDPKERDGVSALCAAYMVGQGARVVRTHNIEATRRALEDSRRAVIGMGSNMGNSAEHLDHAVEALRTHPDVWVSAVSGYFTSEPAYYEDQDPFVNAVAVIQTTLGPYALLDLLHGIENDQGRVRTIENGPRTLDLDIVDYEGVASEDPVLTLPHPLALERDFVVTPLLSIAPGFVLSDGRAVDHKTVAVGKVIDSVNISQ